MISTEQILSTTNVSAQTTLNPLKQQNTTTPELEKKNIAEQDSKSSAERAELEDIMISISATDKN